MTQNNLRPQYIVRSAIMTAERLGDPDKGIPLGEMEFDLTTNIAELVIFESLDKPYLTGNVVISDADGLFSGIQFQGTERITFTIGTADTDNTEVIISKRFILSGINKQKKSNTSGNSSVYVFTLIDEHGFLGRVSKISKSYNGSLETIIKRILQNELGRTVDIAYTGAKKGDEEFSAQQDITCIIPNLTPVDAIDWLCRRITTENGSPYFVYATLQIPDLRNEGSTNEEDLKQGTVVRLGNLDTMLTQSAINKIPYRYNPNTTGKNTELSQEEQSFSIKNIETGISSNTLVLLELGAIASQYSNTNLGTGELFTTKHTLKEQLRTLDSKSIIHSEGEKNLSQNVYDPFFKLKDVSVDEYNAKKYHTITSTGTYGNLKSYHDETDENKFKLKVASTAMKNVLHKNPLSIIIEGAAFLTARGTVGDIINIDVIGDNVDASQEGSRISDVRYSGNHLIYNIKHVFTSDNHNITMNVCKLESEAQ